MNNQQRERLNAHGLAAHLIQVEASAEGKVERKDDYALGFTGAELPVHNFMIPTALAGLTDETLADASAFFGSRDVMYAISLEEHRVPDGTEYLSRRRYQPLPPQTIMVREVLPTEKPNSGALRIERVNTIPDLTACYTIWQNVYDFTPEEVKLLFPATQFQQDNLQHFVGFTTDGEPAVCGSVVCAEQVVSIWNLATLDQYRRQGFAGLLVEWLLAEAAQQGCDMSMIYATPMAFSLVNNLGYELYAMRQWFLPQEIG